LPGLIKNDRRKRKQEKNRASNAIAHSREQQIQLAKQRIRDSSGLGGV